MPDLYIRPEEDYDLGPQGSEYERESGPRG